MNLTDVEKVLRLTFPEWETELCLRIETGIYTHRDLIKWLEQKLIDGCEELGLEIHRIH